MKFVATWMDLDSINLSEISLKELLLSYMVYTKTQKGINKCSKSAEIENWFSVVRLPERRAGMEGIKKMEGQWLDKNRR